ncbi:MutS domain V [Belliella buryatensis]|uniref:MutS domain V n=1 Tax=Belliella buryatensis TaxID=1500549 RepID=A0A239E8C2_9BACT|nr:DNA mismatch repair protein [Belliella buryatensis]SNS40719.1 MutS domain V [Belliella buryatensis]
MITEIDFELLQKELAQAKKKATALSLIRLFLFFLILAIAIVGLSEIRLLLLSLPVALGFFVFLIIQFNQQKDKEAFIKQLMQMELEAKKRKARDLNLFRSGERYQDKNHPFANDLDLFGEHSLFQLLNHTVNQEGESLLVDWMKSPINSVKAKVRFEAIKELSEKQQFLKKFEALGRAFIGKEKSKKDFYHWLEKPQIWKSWQFLPMILGPIGGLGILAGTLFFELPYGWIGVWIILGMVFLGLVFQSLQEAAQVMPNEGDVKTFGLWSAILVNEKFEGAYLKRLQHDFKNQEVAAPEVLKSLEQKTFMIQNRFNLVYLIFNLLFWTDFFLWWRLLVWKNKNAQYLQTWEGSLTEWQVLISLGAFTSEEGLVQTIDWTNEDLIEVKNIKHPLLHPEKAVGNDFSMDAKNQIVLLTGANMSGKTTFMRTLGINLVLVNLGLSPFASFFRCGHFQLFTSMRNSDNLGESVSSFYAELARIKLLLDTASEGIKVFFLLDEILKGTNTEDRIMGSEALIKQLAAAGGKGIISTHDIELSTLESKLKYLKNKSFHSEILDQEIHFDYTIKDGPCPSFNAHKLMELMGIRFS